MAYVTLGSVPDSFWSNAKYVGEQALAEIEDAADGVLGKNVKEEQLAWVQAAQPRLHQAIQFKKLDLLRDIQEGARKAYAALPTAFYARVNPFLSLTIPAEPAASTPSASPSSAGASSAPSSRSSRSASSQSFDSFQAPSSGKGLYIGLAAAGVALALILSRK